MISLFYDPILLFQYHILCHVQAVYNKLTYNLCYFCNFLHGFIILSISQIKEIFFLQPNDGPTCLRGRCPPSQQMTSPRRSMTLCLTQKKSSTSTRETLRSRRSWVSWHLCFVDCWQRHMPLPVFCWHFLMCHLSHQLVDSQHHWMITSACLVSPLDDTV